MYRLDGKGGTEAPAGKGRGVGLSPHASKGKDPKGKGRGVGPSPDASMGKSCRGAKDGKGGTAGKGSSGSASATEFRNTVVLQQQEHDSAQIVSLDSLALEGGSITWLKRAEMGASQGHVAHNSAVREILNEIKHIRTLRNLRNNSTVGKQLTVVPQARDPASMTGSSQRCAKGAQGRAHDAVMQRGFST